MKKEFNQKQFMSERYFSAYEYIDDSIVKEILKENV